MVPEWCNWRDWDWVRRQHLSQQASQNSASNKGKVQHDFKKDIFVLRINWFHTATSVIKISEYCKKFAAYSVLASGVYSVAMYWRDALHKVKKIMISFEPI